MQLIFASKNEHKVAEIRALLPAGWQLLSLNDMGEMSDIEETGETLEANALLKAQTIYSKTQLACFADDSGLEVDALHGKPGVHSARYAGPEKNDRKNGEKLLQELAGHTQRGAQFRTVIALVSASGTHYFEGAVKGNILHEFRGDMGFGYDPLFVPEGWDKTFAQVPMEVKNSVSHRALALRKFVAFLKNVEKR